MARLSSIIPTIIRHKIMSTGSVPRGLLLLLIAWRSDAVDISSNLVIHLTASEGSGATAHDVSGNGNDLTLANGATWDPNGVNGPYAFAFNGIDQYLYRPVTAYTGSITYAAWIKTSHSQGSWVSESATGDGCYNLQSFINSEGRVVADFWDNGDSPARRIVTGTTNVTDGTWHHLALTINNAWNQMALYVDGALEGALTTSGDDAGYSRLWFGGVHSARASGHCLHGNDVVNGLMDEIRAYHRALNAYEIQALARPPQPSLVQQLWLEVRELRALVAAGASNAGARRNDCGEFIIEERVDGPVCKLRASQDSNANAIVISVPQ